MPVFDLPDAPQARERSNTVTIVDAGQGIASINYVPDSLVISEGQPSTPPPTISSTDDGTFTITLEAGREKTEGVATQFIATTGGSSKMYAPSGGGGTPDKLNFYFAVTINFKSGGSATVYLAQGSFALTNNWWIGGAAIFSEDVPRLEYPNGNSINTYALSGDNDRFDLQLTDVRPFSPITNVFVLMLENHSFDNIFARSKIPGIIAATEADSNSYDGTTYHFRGNAPGAMPSDPGHEFTDVLEQLAGPGAVYTPNGAYPEINNSGFVANYATTTTEGPVPPEADIGDIMAGFDTEQQLVGIYDLAKNYVLCDQWFSSLPGPTWPNRFFLHGASSAGLDHSPSSAEIAEWELPDGLGFQYPNGSIFDALTSAEITWRLYHDNHGPLEGVVSQVSAIHNIELWDVHPLTDFINDIQQSTYPYQYTFIEPNYGDVVNGSYENGSSQHPKDNVAAGDALITTVYEAIRNSPLWESSLLIITYDEHGGFYDHYPPGKAVPPNDGSSTKYSRYGFNFSQYGVRVPAVVVSPWTAAGVVDHTVYDHSSVLATLEWLFGLRPLTARDAAATSLHGLITQTLRKDTPARLRRPAAAPAPTPKLTPEQFAALELEPVPDQGTLVGMLGVALKAHRKLTNLETAKARYERVKTRGDARAYLREVMTLVEAERVTRARKQA